MRSIRGWATISLIVAPLLAGCGDFLEVTNPGPLQDEALNTPGAMPALVNGMSGDLAYALSRVAYITALASGEHASSGSYLWTGLVARGEMQIEEAPDIWGAMHRARWVAEKGIERMRQVMGAGFDNSPLAARAYLIAGLSNRLLGETVCQAVFDGGAPGDPREHLSRAKGQLEKALSIAKAINDTKLINATIGAAASVSASLGEWEEASDMAAVVPVGFVYYSIYSLNSSREYNYFVSETYQRLEATVYGTEWADLVDDPRVPWATLYDAGGAVRKGQDGKTPMFQQRKYPTRGDDVALTKGTEMLLIRAEALLRKDNVVGAMNLINEQRAHYGMPELEAATVAAAWPILQKERGAVLWIEGRRLWDLRRWHAEGRNDFLTGRDNCVPASLDERRANPNF